MNLIREKETEVKKAIETRDMLLRWHNGPASARVLKETSNSGGRLPFGTTADHTNEGDSDDGSYPNQMPITNILSGPLATSAQSMNINEQ